MENQTEVSAVLNCIDLSNPDIHQSAALVKQACMDSGFFCVINHGISEEFMDKVFAQAKKFFTLPQSEKKKLVYKREHHRGYEIYKAFDQETNQPCEGESLLLVQETEEVDEDAKKPLRGLNAWPPADVLPGWKETTMRYQEEILNVGKAVARIIAVALDLNPDFFDQKELLGNALSSLSFNHYAGVDPTKEFTVVNPAHTDVYLITLLATNDIPGLQICKNRDAKPRVWENVLPLKGAFIVNLGDMLERMSNCVFRSTLHRVLVSKFDRYSIAYFLCPSYEGNIECIPSCKSEEDPPKYLPIKCGEYLDNIFISGGY